MKKIHRGQSVASYWLSEEPKEHENGLKVVINFDNEFMALIEENIKGRQCNGVIMGFDEFENLQAIMKERK